MLSTMHNTGSQTQIQTKTDMTDTGTHLLLRQTHGAREVVEAPGCRDPDPDWHWYLNLLLCETHGAREVVDAIHHA